MHPAYPPPLAPPQKKTLHNHCVQFLLGINSRPKRDRRQWLCNFFCRGVGGWGGGEQGVLWPMWKWWITILSWCLQLTFWFKHDAQHDINKLTMPKIAKKKHVKKKTRPKIKRNQKYQLLCQQANNCVFKKNQYISHVKCESFCCIKWQWWYEGLTAKQCTHKIKSTTGTVRYTNSLKNKVDEANFHLCRDSKAEAWKLTIVKKRRRVIDWLGGGLLQSTLALRTPRYNWHPDKMDSS